MKHVDFSANAQVKSYGDICCVSWPSSLHDELSMCESDSDSFLSTSVVYRPDNTPLIQTRARQPSKPASYGISKSLRFQVRFPRITWSVDGGRNHVDSDSFLTCPHFSCDLRDFRLVADPSEYKLLDYSTFAFT